jgi:glycosyltransferase involved in cell wall biosynthesis
VFEPVNQIGRARNTGAAAATGEWLLFVDADSAPQPGLFREFVKAVGGGACLAGGSTIAFQHAPLGARIAVGVWNAASRLGKWAAGSFIFCEAAAFREAGGFSEALYAAEELDLFRRLKRIARRDRRRIEILHRHPLATSARKVHLYSWREHLGFMAKTLATGGRSLRNRNDCQTWYDGRR